MKKKNKRGFFLSETMVVIAIVSVVLLTVFKIFSSVYIKYKESENYNTVNATNAVVQLRKFYQATEFDYNALLNGSYYVDLTNSTQYDGEYYENLKQVLKVDKVYLINMAAVFSGTNINVFNTSLRKYLKTMQGTESTVTLVVITDGNQYGSVTVLGEYSLALVGDAADEYSVIVPLGGTFTDPGYTNWYGDAPTTTWEPTLNTSVEGTYYLKYNFDGFLLRRKVIVVKLSNTYDYTGSVQTFTVPVTGYYFVELYGAQGGESLYTTNYNGGNGGYTSGYISLTKGEVLYIYVGGKGQKSVGTSSSVLTINGNGYNGGGYAAFSSNNNDKGGGGGATDIRFFSSTPSTADLSWNSTLGLNSRIMVAGGGGGSSSHVSTPNYSGTGGVGGNLVAGNGIYASNTCYAYGTGGTQISGGTTPPCPSDGQAYTGNGAFGIGNTPYTSYNTSGATAGGGGGYYGGGGGYHAPAGGGSSFISGYAGVNAITSASSTTATYNIKHYSGKYFINGNMISGVNSGSSYGNGSAKITYYGTNAPTKTNTKLNNVRYIKDCENGTASTGSSHWVELQAIYQGTNIAKGKTVTGTFTENSSFPYSRITDGDITSSVYTDSYTGNAGMQCITVDLGQAYNLDEVAVWHYWADGRTYYSNTTYTSSNNSDWNTIISTSEPETDIGKRATAWSNYRVVNLVTNGGFEKINQGWTISPPISIVFDGSGQHGYYIANNYHGGQYSAAYRGIDTANPTAYGGISAIANHVYYVSLWEYTNNKGNGYCYADFNINYESTNHWQGLGGAQSNINVWEKFSRTITIPNVTTPTIGLAVADTTASDALQNCYADGVLLVDLTATFGAGNEPSKAWCDLNLNYFDGNARNFNLTL